VGSGPALAPGTVVGNQFRIAGVLGAGGMGVVYAAQHLRLPRLVAVKVLHPHLLRDEGALARFWREAQNAASINSPYVATVYDFGVEPDGAAYLAMEYVAGCTLREFLGPNAPVAPPLVAELVRQIAAGLDAAHALGIVHRDLTPANVMVTRDAGGREQVKLVDFGIAKVVDDEQQAVTQTGFVTARASS
jgi:serine/threonine-protein kinase